MADNFIQSVQDATKDAPKSIKWYRNKIQDFGKPKPLDLIRDGKRATIPSSFNLNMFIYDPKHKKTLPYYDTFPLVLSLERYNDGSIENIPEGNQYKETDRLRVSYQRAIRLPGEPGRMAKAVVKRYLYGHMKSQVRIVTPDEWVIAVLLPVQRFRKASTSKVYNRTKKLYKV